MRYKTNVIELQKERRKTYIHSKHRYFELQSAVDIYVLNFFLFLLLSLLLMMMMNIENLTIQISTWILIKLFVFHNSYILIYIWSFTTYIAQVQILASELWYKHCWHWIFGPMQSVMREHNIWLKHYKITRWDVFFPFT